MNNTRVQQTYFKMIDLLARILKLGSTLNFLTNP
jgi:23S rRNA G2069 N7-methylase RlmK/C1962 C5-methylase RlmI